MKSSIKKLLAIGAVLASSQVSALPSFYNTTYNHQYQVDFTTPTGSLSIAETSNQSSLLESFYYAEEEGLFFNNAISPFFDTRIRNGEIELVGMVFNGQDFSGGGINDDVIIASAADFSVATGSFTTMFDVVGESIDFTYLGLTDGADTDFSVNLERNIGGQVTSIVDFTQNGDIVGPASHTLSEGTYTLSSNLNILSISGDSSRIGFQFQETQTPVSVPEPYTPLLLIMSLLTIIRLKKVKK